MVPVSAPRGLAAALLASVLAVSLAFLATGCGERVPDPAPEIPPAVQPAAGTETEPPPATDAAVTLYMVSAGENLMGIQRSVPAGPDMARTAMEQLLRGMTASDRETWPALSTAIPAGSRLLGLSVEDGVARVDLSSEFASGGGSFSVIARLAQVTNTLCVVPGVDAVEFWLEGERVEVFSSEGLILEGPQRPEDFDVPVDA